MAEGGWIVDKSAEARAKDPVVRRQLLEPAGKLYVCPMGELEILSSARSALDYDGQRGQLHANFTAVAAPPDLLERAPRLQRDLAHHHGMWHRIPVPDLLIAETALFHDLGIVHVDRDSDRITEVRPLVARRLG